MKPGSRKNIDPVMADVRHPQPRKKVGTKRASKELKTWHKWVLATIALIMLAAAVFLVDIGSSARAIQKELRNIFSGFISFDSGLDYAGSLSTIEGELASLDSRARLFALAPKLREIPGIIGDLRDIVNVAKELSQDFALLASDGLSSSLAGDGSAVITGLNNMRARLVVLNGLGSSIKARAKNFDIETEEVEALTAGLEKTEEGLGALISFLDRPEPRRLVLLFENPSELRPAGGFAGSYGELVLERAGMKSLVVNDIYYPDHFLPREVVPPLQLQSITPDWGARDMGWFFDFSVSAEKFLDYLEASTIYTREDIQFDGVVAVNVRVVEDLLRLTGPIEVPEYQMTLTHENFLRTIQEEVQLSQAPGENPKVVLQFAAPRLLDALGQLEGQKKQQLLQIFAARAQNKDVKFYFKEPQMQELVVDLGVAGKPYEITEDFVGDYLALVNTNVAGGKTDYFVSQRTILRSAIDADGWVDNDLIVTRSHRGGDESEPWYKTVNQNFFKIFTYPGSEVRFIRGGSQKEINRRLNYSSVSYDIDPDLAELEDTRTILGVEPDGYVERYLESSRSVFATWFNLDPGQSKTLEMRWQAVRVPVVSGTKHTFVLDKQSGSEMDFEYLLAAPPGYYFIESGSDLFRYRNEKLPARLEIELTLEKK